MGEGKGPIYWCQCKIHRCPAWSVQWSLITKWRISIWICRGFPRTSVCWIMRLKSCSFGPYRGPSPLWWRIWPLVYRTLSYGAMKYQLKNRKLWLVEEKTWFGQFLSFELQKIWCSEIWVVGETTWIYFELWKIWITEVWLYLDICYCYNLRETPWWASCK